MNPQRRGVVVAQRRQPDRLRGLRSSRARGRWGGSVERRVHPASQPGLGSVWVRVRVSQARLARQWVQQTQKGVPTLATSSSVRRARALGAS